MAEELEIRTYLSGHGQVVRDINSLVGQVQAFFRLATTVQDQHEQQLIRLITAFKSVEEGYRRMEEARRFAAQTPYEVAEVVDFYTTLAFAVDASQVDLLRLTRAAGDAASAMGLLAGETQMFMDVIARSATGRREALESLAYWTRNAVILRREMFLPGGPFAGMTYAQALIYALEAAFGGQMENRMRTLSGAISNLYDALNQIKRDVVAPFMPGLIAFIHALSETLHRLHESGAISRFAQNFKENFVDSVLRGLAWLAVKAQDIVTSIADWLSDTWFRVSRNIAAYIAYVWDIVKGFFIEVGEYLGTVGHNLSEAMKVVFDIPRYISEAISNFYKAYSDWMKKMGENADIRKIVERIRKGEPFFQLPEFKIEPPKPLYEPQYQVADFSLYDKIAAADSNLAARRNEIEEELERRREARNRNRLSEEERISNIMQRLREKWQEYLRNERDWWSSHLPGLQQYWDFFWQAYHRWREILSRGYRSVNKEFLEWLQTARVEVEKLVKLWESVEVKVQFALRAIQEFPQQLATWFHVLQAAQPWLDFMIVQQIQIIELEQVMINRIRTWRDLNLFGYEALESQYRAYQKLVQLLELKSRTLRAIYEWQLRMNQAIQQEVAIRQQTQRLWHDISERALTMQERVLDLFTGGMGGIILAPQRLEVIRNRERFEVAALQEQIALLRQRRDVLWETIRTGLATEQMILEYRTMTLRIEEAEANIAMKRLEAREKELSVIERIFSVMGQDRALVGMAIGLARGAVSPATIQEWGGRVMMGSSPAVMEMMRALGVSFLPGHMGLPRMRIDLRLYDEKGELSYEILNDQTRMLLQPLGLRR